MTRPALRQLSAPLLLVLCACSRPAIGEGGEMAFIAPYAFMLMNQEACPHGFTLTQRDYIPIVSASDVPSAWTLEACGLTLRFDLDKSLKGPVRVQARQWPAADSRVLVPLRRELEVARAAMPPRLPYGEGCQAQPRGGWSCETKIRLVRSCCEYGDTYELTAWGRRRIVDVTCVGPQHDRSEKCTARIVSESTVERPTEDLPRSE